MAGVSSRDLVGGKPLAGQYLRQLVPALPG